MVLYFSLYFKKISDIIDIIGNKNEMECYGQVKQRKKNGDKRYHDNAGSTGDEAAAGAGFSIVRLLDGEILETGEGIEPHVSAIPYGVRTKDVLTVFPEKH